jgi:hypothetical protein
MTAFGDDVYEYSRLLVSNGAKDETAISDQNAKEHVLCYYHYYYCCSVIITVELTTSTDSDSHW